MIAHLADEATDIAFNSFFGTSIKIQDFCSGVIAFTAAELKKKINDERWNTALLTAHRCMGGFFHFMAS
jgi:hypothetical protein